MVSGLRRLIRGKKQDMKDEKQENVNCGKG